MAFPHSTFLIVCVFFWGSAIVFFILFYFCSCRNPFNATLNWFAHATGTWYDPPNGHGTDTGACGYGNVGNPPYNSLIAARNQALYQSGKGCGQCYEVQCTSDPACSENPIKIYITDECPGECNSDPVCVDLSETAFGTIAKPGQADGLRNAGKIQINSHTKVWDVKMKVNVQEPYNLKL